MDPLAKAASDREDTSAKKTSVDSKKSVFEKVPLSKVINAVLRATEMERTEQDSLRTHLMRYMHLFELRKHCPSIPDPLELLRESCSPDPLPTHVHANLAKYPELLHRPITCTAKVFEGVPDGVFATWALLRDGAQFVFVNSGTCSATPLDVQVCLLPPGSDTETSTFHARANGIACAHKAMKQHASYYHPTYMQINMKYCSAIDSPPVACNFIFELKREEYPGCKAPCRRPYETLEVYLDRVLT